MDEAPKKPREPQPEYLRELEQAARPLEHVWLVYLEHEHALAQLRHAHDVFAAQRVSARWLAAQELIVKTYERHAIRHVQSLLSGSAPP